MSKELKKTKEEQELASRVTAFCLASAALRELRQKLFPYGTAVVIDSLAYVGPGTVAYKSDDDELIRLPVETPNGRVWTYDLQGVSLVVEAKGDA
tara:strand:+ start:999 stop:1283 length:285 start_codon:yes stop_codon:yes gene_type:complete